MGNTLENGALKCVSCELPQVDVKSLKRHVLDEHVYNSKTERPRPVLTGDQLNDENAKKPKRTKLSEANSDEDAFKEAILERLHSMTDDDFKNFNIGDKIDEREIYRRARLLTPKDECVKSSVFVLHIK